MKTILKNCVKTRRGQGLTEYMILIFLVAMASLGATRIFGDRVQDSIRQSADKIERCLSLTNGSRDEHCR
jgi:pilus assembly protein Flp/PilA